MVENIQNPGEASSERAEAASTCCSSSNHMQAIAVEPQEITEVVSQLSRALPRLQQALTRRRTSDEG
jgi:hypothetical protein